MAGGRAVTDVHYPREVEIALASFERTIALAPPEKKMAVFTMMTREAVAVARKFDVPERDVIDRFNDLAAANGLIEVHGVDAVQEALAVALTSQPNGKASDANRAPSGYDWRSTMVSASALRTMTFDPVRFVVPGLVPEGLTLLVSRPKAGKSWLALDLCIAAAGDRFTLGTIKPAQGDVLYLALEDSKRRLQRRMTKLLPTFGGEWPDRLKLVTEWRRTDQGGLNAIAAWCDSVERPVLIVVDTLAKFRKPANGKQQLYDSDYEALTGLQKIAIERGIAIVVIHHDRKGDAEDPFDTVSGTLGLTAAADAILIIKRRSSGTTLYARGRDIEESETAVQFSKETCKWTMLGPAAEVHRSDERRRVIDALCSAGGPLSVTEIMAAADIKSRGAADKLLFTMAQDGEIERRRRGVYDLTAENIGKIGKKDVSRSESADSADACVRETDLLTNLPNLPDHPLVKRCSGCGKPHDRATGGGYCRKCHADYQREWRKKQRAELERLRAKESLN
jgi:AAA domain